MIQCFPVSFLFKSQNIRICNPKNLMDYLQRDYVFFLEEPVPDMKFHLINIVLQQKVYFQKNIFCAPMHQSSIAKLLIIINPFFNITLSRDIIFFVKNFCPPISKFEIFQYISRYIFEYLYQKVL